MVLDELADRVSAPFKTPQGERRSSPRGALRPGGPKLILAKPNTFMNLSGGPVAALLRSSTRSTPSRLIVLHDELDIPFDTVQLKTGGGHGGHNGLRDIIAAIGTPDFTRVRVGVGRPPGRQDAADFVLHDFAPTSGRCCRICWRMPPMPPSSSSPTASPRRSMRFHSPA